VYLKQLLFSLEVMHWSQSL